MFSLQSLLVFLSLGRGFGIAHLVYRKLAGSLPAEAAEKVLDDVGVLLCRLSFVINISRFCFFKDEDLCSTRLFEAVVLCLARLFSTTITSAQVSSLNSHSAFSTGAVIFNGSVLMPSQEHCPFSSETAWTAIKKQQTAWCSSVRSSTTVDTWLIWLDRHFYCAVPSYNESYRFAYGCFGCLAYCLIS